MTQQRCHLCNEPMEGARARVTFEGFEKLALNGVTFVIHAACLRMQVPERGIPLPESQLVTVYQSEGDWLANCRDHGAVALKAERDDAELGAARHLARMHVEFVA